MSSVLQVFYSNILNGDFLFFQSFQNKIYFFLFQNLYLQANFPIFQMFKSEEPYNVGKHFNTDYQQQSAGDSLPIKTCSNGDTYSGCSPDQSGSSQTGDII